jgi:hypothetical protein
MKVTRRQLKQLVTEAVITGRKLDWYSTLISREVVNAIKDQEIKDYFYKNKKVTFRMDIPHVTNDLEWLRHVYLTLIPGDGTVDSHAQYEYDRDATPEERKTSDMKIIVMLPLNYTDRVLSSLIPALKGTIRHELEHAGQPTEVLMEPLKTIKSQSDIWSSLKNAQSYYINQAETPAHIAGWVKQAKMEGIPAANMIDHELNRIYATGLHFGYPEEEMKPFMNRLREIYQFYLMSRWPEQEWPSEYRED